MGLVSNAIGNSVLGSVRQVFPKDTFSPSSQRSYYQPAKTVDARAQLENIKNFKFTKDFSTDLLNFMKQNFMYVAQVLIRKFAQTAAVYTPPGKKGGKKLGSAYIDEAYYYRPYYKIEDLAKGNIRTERGRRLYATKEDYAALRAGYKYKILNTKHGVKLGTVYAYAKGINEAKRVSRIKNRGLSKYSWGSIINSFSGRMIGAASRQGARKENNPVWYTRARGLYEVGLPAIFLRLRKKSPNIQKYKWGFVDYTETAQHKMQFTIVNTLAGIQNYARIAIRQGTRAMQKQFRKLSRIIESGTAQNLDKMFNYDLSKVTEVQKYVMRDVKTKKKG